MVEKDFELETVPQADSGQADGADSLSKMETAAENAATETDGENTDSLQTETEQTAPVQMGEEKADYAPQDNFYTAPQEMQPAGEDWRLSFAQYQLEMYQNREIDKMMADDLAAVQALDPSVTALSDLPDSFFALRFNSLSPMGAARAYTAAKAVEQASVPPKPASAGPIEGESGGESEYFTADELDRLTPKMLDNPKIMEKALRSMTKLG